MRYATLRQDIGDMANKVCDKFMGIYGSLKPEKSAVVPVREYDATPAKRRKTGKLSLIALYVLSSLPGCSNKHNPMAIQQPDPKAKVGISIVDIITDGKNATAKVLADGDGFVRYTIRTLKDSTIISDSGYVTGGDTTSFTENGLPVKDYIWEVISANSEGKVFTIHEQARPSSTQNSLPNTDDPYDSKDENNADDNTAPDPVDVPIPDQTDPTQRDSIPDGDEGDNSQDNDW